MWYKCGISMPNYKINEYNKNNLNIFEVLSVKDDKEQINNAIGTARNLKIKVYENNAHHAYDNELYDIKDLF